MTAKKAVKAKPSEPTSTVYVTAVGPEALDLCKHLATAWNKHYAKDEGFTPVRPQDILGEALSNGLHVLGLQELGDPNAWDADAGVFAGASDAADALQKSMQETAEAARGRDTSAETEPMKNWAEHFARQAERYMKLTSMLDVETQSYVFTKFEIALEKELIKKATKDLEAEASGIDR
jgi:hypothetical protein